MKHPFASLLATALLLALPQLTRADEFAQIQNSPNTYWVPAPAGQGQAQVQQSADPKAMQSPTGNPQQGYAAAPPPGYYAPGPGYYPPPGYVVAPPPPGYYGPPVAYYGPGRYYGPPVAASYYSGPHGSRVFIGIPGLFLGFHIH